MLKMLPPSWLPRVPIIRAQLAEAYDRPAVELLAGVCAVVVQRKFFSGFLHQDSALLGHHWLLERSELTDALV